MLLAEGAAAFLLLYHLLLSILFYTINYYLFYIIKPFTNTDCMCSLRCRIFEHLNRLTILSRLYASAYIIAF